MNALHLAKIYENISNNETFFEENEGRGVVLTLFVNKIIGLIAGFY